MKKQKQLPAVAQKLLVEATTRLKMLESKFGFQYAVFSKDFNVKDGALTVKIPGLNRQKRNSHAEFGDVTKYVRPFIANLKEDEIVQIKFGGFHPRSIYSSAHSLCTRAFGVGNFIFELTDDHLEVWRSAMVGKLSVRVEDLEAAPETVDDAV